MLSRVFKLQKALLNNFYNLFYRFTKAYLHFAHEKPTQAKEHGPCSLTTLPFTSFTFSSSPATGDHGFPFLLLSLFSLQCLVRDQSPTWCLTSVYQQCVHRLTEVVLIKINQLQVKRLALIPCIETHNVFQLQDN